MTVFMHACARRVVCINVTAFAVNVFKGRTDHFGLRIMLEISGWHLLHCTNMKGYDTCVNVLPHCQQGCRSILKRWCVAQSQPVHSLTLSMMNQDKHSSYDKHYQQAVSHGNLPARMCSTCFDWASNRSCRSESSCWHFDTASWSLVEPVSEWT